VALITFLSTLTRTIEGFLPHSGTQRLPNPIVRPEHASPDKLTLAIILLDAGSIRCTEFGLVVATQTASSVTRTQSAVLPIFGVAIGFKEANGTWTPFTPGLETFDSVPEVWASTT
jgi:hypothetical protein